MLRSLTLNTSFLLPWQPAAPHGAASQFAVPLDIVVHSSTLTALVRDRQPALSLLLSRESIRKATTNEINSLSCATIVKKKKRSWAAGESHAQARTFVVILLGLRRHGQAIPKLTLPTRLRGCPHLRIKHGQFLAVVGRGATVHDAGENQVNCETFRRGEGTVPGRRNSAANEPEIRRRPVGRSVGRELARDNRRRPRRELHLPAETCFLLNSRTHFPGRMLFLTLRQQRTTFLQSNTLMDLHPTRYVHQLLALYLTLGAAGVTASAEELCQ
jgi:hypothetical protein